PAASSIPADTSEDDLILAQVKLGREVLADALPGYSDRGRLLLPLGQLAELLQFPIRVSPGEGRAEGWFLSRDRRFLLDMARREVIVGSDRDSVDISYLRKSDDDLYVDSTLLSQW